MNELQQLGDFLRQLLAPVLGEHPAIENLEQLTGGAAAQTWAFTACTVSENHELILRLGRDQQQFGAALSKRLEADLIRAAKKSGVLAPEVLIVLADGGAFGEGFVMRRVAGEALPQRILRETRYAGARAGLAEQCAFNLSAIHAIALDAVPALPRLHALKQLELYRDVYLGYPFRSPVFEFAFRWLERHAHLERPSAVVHGDFRNGNLLIDEGGITAVLDWELAHIGDPMEDLGWLCVNSWRFGQRDLPVGGFGQRTELYTAYAQASGNTVNADIVHYWEVFGTLKWGVICLYQADAHMSGTEPSLERAAIGRRVSEVEIDLISLFKGQQP